MGSRNPARSVTITQEMKLDLRMWLVFFKEFNGKTLLSYKESLSSTELNMFSDSSKSGFGATLGSHFICGEFPERGKSLDIQTLEIYPIMALVAMFAEQLAQKSITMYCDNISVVHALNSFTSRNVNLMKILRPLVLCLLRNNISFKACHIPGVTNILCDKLSRQQVSTSLLRFYGMDKSPTQVWPCLLPQNLRIL